MHERYLNQELYFTNQAKSTKKYIVPYIRSIKEIEPSARILEIGCGGGGNLEPFAKMQVKEIVGIDLDKNAITFADKMYSSMEGVVKPTFICRDMYEITKSEIGEFDIIIMRDVIEHIVNQEKFLAFIKQFLKEDGVIFFGFPPWQMPFGGHQQVADSKLVQRLPYVHLLPLKTYISILRKSGESESKIAALLDIRKTGISIERFKKAVKNAGYKFEDITPYFINPNYEIKFNLKPRKKIPVIGDIPCIRNFVTTCIYAVISKR